MPKMILDLRIENLRLCNPKVKKKNVGRYIMRLKHKEEVKPISVIYCIHDGSNNVTDGRHRATASHFYGKSSIIAEVEPCYHYHCDGTDFSSWKYNIRHIKLE